MGNSASSLPYSIGEKRSTDGCWAVHDGSRKNDKSPVTVFQAQKAALAKEGYREDPGRFQIFVAHHHFLQCKKLRHPYILQVQATLDTDNPNNEDTSSTSPQNMATTGSYIIVTEKAIPLTEWLEEKNPTQDQLAWGLQCIVQSMSFLHNSAQLAHGNMSPSTFWVTPGGDVKLWNFSLVTPIGVADGGGGPTHHFKDYEGILTPQAFRSPERVQRQWNALATSGLHCMDSYGLGILINDYYNGNIPGPLRKAVQRLQTPSLKMRPRLGPLLRCPVFDTQYSKFLSELEELHIQPVEQKLRFWQTIQMDNTDNDVAQFKILPLIQSTIKTICSSESMLSQDLYRREVLAMLSPLFHIADHVLSGEETGKELTPLMQLLFAVKDRAVRGALLSKTPLLASHLSQQDINHNVFEPLCSGFADSSDALRELTLKATLVLVPHLYPPNVEKLSRYLVRLQSDTSPNIRTNAMSMIPRLAPHLSEVAREKLLLPAFVRGFKDPHAPCRLAALQAVAGAKPFFSLEDLATKVLPSVMPLVLDAISDVRANAFLVIETFLTELKQEHSNRSYGDVDVTTSTAPKKPAPSSGSYLSGLSSWYAAPVPEQPPAPAFSSLTVSGDTTSAADGWDDDDDDVLDDLGHSNNDVFASLDLTPKTTTFKPNSSGKLIMKKGVPKKPEVKKLSMDDDIQDGWDDF